MTEINLKLDRRNLARFRTLLKASKKSAAQVLTFTAQRAVPEWKAGHSVFRKRNGWIDKGVRYRPASMGNLEARVGTVDKWMGRHIRGLGQEKEAEGRGLFVPAQPASQQPTHTRIRAALRRARASKTKPFLVKGRDGEMLVRRKGKKRGPFKVIGYLRKKVDIPERLDAQGIVEGVVNREFPTLYERLLVKWAEEGR